MNASDSITVGPVTPTAVRPVPRAMGDASTVGVGKQGISRLNSRAADAATKSRLEAVEGNLHLDDVLYGFTFRFLYLLYYVTVSFNLQTT